MGVWTDTKDDTRCGVVVCAFGGEERRRLKLSVGDAVLIFKQCQGWYYGCNLRSQHIKGIFPVNYVHLKEVSIPQSGSYMTVIPKELPIVNEMTAVVREWGKIWKNLYVTHRAPKSEEERKFQDLRNMITELMEGRKKIMSRKLTVEELKVTQQKYSHIIDIGNAKLGLDLVVRDDEGNTLDPLKTSTINLFRQHEVATKRIERRLKGITSDAGTMTSSSFNLWVNLKAFVCNVTEMSEVYLSLYDPTTNSFFAESFLAKYGDKGLPRDIEMLNHLKVLFTDLGQKDLARERIFLICQVIRFGRMLLNEEVNKKETHDLRRPFGIAAWDITDIIKSADTDERPHFVPFHACGERDNLDSLIRKVVSGKEMNDKNQGLHLVIRKLVGDLQQVRKESPTLVANPTKIARKLGFPDVILPDDVRNDLYVTLVQGEFKKGGKSSDKNVEITMCVCNQHGKVLENVIWEGVGGAMVSEYKSVIYYHEVKPKWCETIKIGISINDFYGSHLKFTFKHRSTNEAKDKSEKPFAVSYIRLMHENGTVTADGQHSLLVYKIDSKKFDNSPTYLKLPSQQKEIENRTMIGQTAPPIKQYQIQTGAFSLNMADRLEIQTLVCSTKLTHNIDLMGLLKWRDNPAHLQQILMQFMRVDGAEVVKFLPDVLDSLFSIFMENSDSDTYDTAVFNALIYVVGLVSDVKYQEFRSVLDLYIRDNYSATLAYNKLMVVLKDQIEDLQEEAKYDVLLKFMTSLPYIFKFIVRSRVLFAALNEQRGKQSFEMGMMQVFQVLTTLMSKTSNKLALPQQALLRHLPSTLTDIIDVFVPQDLSFVLIDLIEKIPKAHFIREKLLFMRDLVHSDLFRFPDCRKIMLVVIMQQLMMLLQKGVEIQTCFTVLSDIMDFLHTDGTSEDISAAMMTILRTISQTIIHMMSQPSAALSNSVAVLVAILRQMTGAHYKLYLSSFDETLDLQDFLMEILMGFKHLVLQCVFPQDWCEMILLQNSVFLKALRHFSEVIKEKFVAPFNFQLWDTFFQCSITFVSQQPLELHNFSTAKRNKIINRYGDMRREAGFEVRAMWYSLGHNKIQFIPDLVELILQMTLIPETELRNATIPVFYDMMLCEYSSQAASRSSRRTGFIKFENELIGKLDKLIAEEGKGDKQYRELFSTILNRECMENDRMRQEAKTFVEMVTDLQLRLLEYRDVIDGENTESKMSCIVGLLNFYEEIRQQELYVVYLHKLCDLHLGCDNYTEAAHTKMLYSKLLQWSDEEVSLSLLNPRDRRESKLMKTQRELKMDTYYDIIDYLDRGKMWEKGIEFCKELANQYETETFDYRALSQILQRQAQFYDGIMMTQRPKPEYFRVAYYGLGFPSFLQNKEFIFRGKDYDKLSEFAGRLQNLFPNATVMRTLNPPTEEMKQSENQYLQINAVNPVLQLKEHLERRTLNEQILKYYKENEVERFLFSRKKDEGGGDLTRMWLERTYLTITQPLPGILRWFPVTSTEIVEVSPLENALETMSSANDRIQSLIDQFEKNANVRVDQLSMVLNGVVDAAVNGGITNYKLFYSDEYLDEHPNHTRLVTKLKDATSLQLLLLHLGLDLHRKNAPDSLMPLQHLLDQRFVAMKSSIEQDYGIKLTKDAQQSIARKHNIALKRIMSMKPRKVSPGPSPLKAVHATHTQRSQSVISRSTHQALPTARPDGKTKVFTRTAQSTRSPRTSAAPSEPSSSPTLNRLTVRADGDEKVIELSQELTPSRPRRPGSRPGSGQFIQAGDPQISASSLSLSSVDSLSTSSLNRMSQDISDAPPPLPLKYSTSVISRDSQRVSVDVEKLEKRNGSEGMATGVAPPLLPEKHAHTMPVLTEKVTSQPLLPDKVIHRKKPPVLTQTTTTPSAAPPVLPPKHAPAAPTIPPRSPMALKPKLVLFPPGVTSLDSDGSNNYCVPPPITPKTPNSPTAGASEHRQVPAPPGEDGGGDETKPAPAEESNVESRL